MIRSLGDRLAKHARLNWQNLAVPEVPSPPFLILFINSICNMKCEHCFYWQQLNQKSDLTFEEIVALSNELGPIENLNLSGGEPFLRKEFAAICRQFIQRNGVKEIYVAATHGVFCGPALERLAAAPITQIAVTDTIPHPPERLIPKIKVLTVAPLLAEAIKRIHHDQSISILFERTEE